MNKKLVRKYTVVALVSFSAIVATFLLISPENKPLPYIFIPVVLVWLFLFSLIRSTFAVIFKTESRVRTLMVFVCVSLLVLLGLLSGVGQLSISDIILAFSLVVVSTFYFYRMWS
jgi:hypothetical protein